MQSCFLCVQNMHVYAEVRARIHFNNVLITYTNVQHSVGVDGDVQRGGLDDGQRRLLLQPQHTREHLQFVQLTGYRLLSVRTPVCNHCRTL